ncbi:hypothetical protein CDIK_0780 [Cucumispora dikerogammari]|nr:hypothetical protein CDIK_0780 [Cucumispora dikerogammari]
MLAFIINVSVIFSSNKRAVVYKQPSLYTPVFEPPNVSINKTQIAVCSSQNLDSKKLVFKFEVRVDDYPLEKCKNRVISLLTREVVDTEGCEGDMTSIRYFTHNEKSINFQKIEKNFIVNIDIEEIRDSEKRLHSLLFRVSIKSAKPINPTSPSEVEKEINAFLEAFGIENERTDGICFKIKFILKTSDSEEFVETETDVFEFTKLNKELILKTLHRNSHNWREKNK